MTISKTLKTLRKKAGYKSARAFAQKNGFSEITYNTHESGKRIPRLKALKAYAKLLDIPSEWLKEDNATARPSSKRGSQPGSKRGGKVAATSAQEIVDIFIHYTKLSKEAKKAFLTILQHDLAA